MAELASPSLADGRPRRVMRTAGGPLLAYHAMILFGAFLVITSPRWGPGFVLGAVLVTGGIALEIAILAWSASLTRAAPSSRRPDPRPLGAPLDEASRRVCVACGFERRGPGVICPRCGRSLVSLGPLD